MEHSNKKLNIGSRWEINVETLTFCPFEHLQMLISNASHLIYIYKCRPLPC